MASTSEENTPLYLCTSVEIEISHRSFGHLLSDLAICIFNFILMVVGIVANVLAIVAYKRTKALQTPSNYLLVILSTFDVLLAVTGQPLLIIWKILELSENPSCVVYIATVLSVNLFAAVSFLVASLLISLERYYSVFHPMLHRNHANKYFFKITVCITALVWLVFFLGAFFGNYHRAYFIFAVTIVITCLLGTAIAYVRIFREISRRWPEHEHEVSLENIADENQQHLPREKTTLVNMIVIVGTMTLFYAPIGGCALYSLLIGRDWLYMNYFMPWAYLFVFASTAINPFLYGWKSRAIRRSIKGVLRNTFEETHV